MTDQQQPSGGMTSTTRWILGGLGLLVIVILTGYLNGYLNTEDTAEDARSSSQSSNQEREKPVAGRQNSYNLSGYGNQSEEVHLERGRAKFTYSYRNPRRSDGGNFIVTLLDENGERVGSGLVKPSIVNEIGNTDGSQTVNIPSSGVYVVNVQASDMGPWTVEIE
jgi:hypothetical protein